MVESKVAIRRMSRYKFYIVAAILIAVVVITYYFMNHAPGSFKKDKSKISLHNSNQRKLELWKQTKFVSNQNMKSQEEIQIIEKPDKFLDADIYSTPKPFNPEIRPMGNGVPVVPFLDKRLTSPPVIDESKDANRQEIWRIKNESRFYGKPSKYFDYFYNMKRLVHLDLKGAPPNMAYLQKLFPLFKQFGATGVILEYEDMFPFKEKFEIIAAPNCYSEEDVQRIQEYADQSNLEIIPLVPTFGHLEFLLKFEEFRYLRDMYFSPHVISPAIEATYTILTEMIRQIVRLHRKSKFLHIGSDEVIGLGEGLSASLIKKGKSREDIFLDHVKYVGRIIKEKIEMQPIMWDDMLRNMESKKIQDSGLGQYVEPMIWSYVTDPAENLPREIWSKYHDCFNNIWVASSFKGATGSGRVMTDASYHLENHLNWIRLIETVGPGARDQEQTTKIRGIALTGWQRYSHFGSLCELLPAGIPSLAVSLKVMQLSGFDKSTHALVSKQLQCEKLVKLDLLEKYADDDGCKFPGSTIYYKLRSLWGKLQTYARVKEDINSYASEFHFRHRFYSTVELKDINSSLVMLNSSIAAIGKFMIMEIPKFFDDMTAREWVEINVKQTVEEISDELFELSRFSKTIIWANRPGYEITKPTNVTNTTGTVSMEKPVKPKFPKLSGFNQINKIIRKFNNFPKTKLDKDPMQAQAKSVDSKVTGVKSDLNAQSVGQSPLNNVNERIQASEGDVRMNGKPTGLNKLQGNTQDQQRLYGQTHQQLNGPRNTQGGLGQRVIGHPIDQGAGQVNEPAPVGLLDKKIDRVQQRESVPVQGPRINTDRLQSVVPDNNPQSHAARLKNSLLDNEMKRKITGHQDIYFPANSRKYFERGNPQSPFGLRERPATGGRENQRPEILKKNTV